MPLDSPRPILSTPKLADFTGFPARSLPTSAGAHAIVITVVLLLGLAPVIIEGPQHLRQRFQPVDLQPQTEDDAPILPEMQSSSASASSPASTASLRSAPGRSGTSSASSMPLIHQRRQHIISNTPDATNPVQTILQPDIPNPPRLAKTLPVPSMVRMAPMRQPAPVLTAPTLSAVVRPAAPPTPAAAPQPTLPKIQPANVDTVAVTSATELVDSPKLAAYATTRTYQPPKPAPAPPAATKPSAPKVVANSAPSPPSTATPAGGTDSRNLLVVNAIEVQSSLSERDIPAAEIHGHFEVTASPSLPEAPTTGGSSSSAGVNGSGVATSGNGAGKGSVASKSAGAGTGGTHGSGAGTGTSNIAGTGAGHGAGLGNGTGSGTGHAGNAGMGNGSGNGPAGGNGSAPFSGMTIVGGSGTSGNGGLHSEPSVANVNPNDPRGSYGLTILSNGGSGGAVRDYGVFTGGPVYTVFLDLSKLGAHSRWSFQYSASRDARMAHPGVPLTPPLPQDERLPQLPAALVTPNVGKLVVVQANLKPDGKLEAFHVLESPDERLNQGIITGLAHWYFDPAAMGSDKIAVKVLFGIPIAPAMADNGISQQADQHAPGDATTHTPAQ